MDTRTRQIVQRNAREFDDPDYFTRSIYFSMKTPIFIVMKQSVFLENSGNKSRFIGLLHPKLEIAGVRTILSADNADRNIVETAISIYSTSMNDGRSVIIVGEDTDLVVLMVALIPRDKEIFFLKPSCGKKESLLYSSAELQGEE